MNSTVALYWSPLVAASTWTMTDVQAPTAAVGNSSVVLSRMAFIRELLPSPVFPNTPTVLFCIVFFCKTAMTLLNITNKMDRQMEKEIDTELQVQYIQ